MIEEERSTKDKIIEVYMKIVEAKGDLPSLPDFASYEISRDKIRTSFGNMEHLHIYMKEYHKDFLSMFFSSIEDMFTGKKQLTSDDASTGRYVITTAVANSPAHTEFIDAIMSYCRRHNAKLIIMPCESITNSFENKTATFDPYFNTIDCYVVTDDVHLNQNFSVCSIQVSAKQIKSITGLSRLGNREGSYVFASPKQFLEYVPSGNNRAKNYAIMTPGACTKPSYFTETFVSKRLSYIAEHDHRYGAIIVDVKDRKIFDFRQIQADEDGKFCDMGIEYSPDGSAKPVEVNIVFGDLHGIHVDMNALKYFLDIFSKMHVNEIFLHDVFDGNSVSHHIKDIVKMAKRYENSKDSLEDELVKTYEVISSIDEKLMPYRINIAKSNHDEFLERYLSSGSYIYDPINHYISLKIATALFENEDVLDRGFKVVHCNPSTHWHFLTRNSSRKIGNVECASHGDLGMNGAKPSLNSLEKVYGKCVVGHNHSAAIQRGVFRVGTLSMLDLEYNRGPSSWTQTCCIVYANGQRQLINYISQIPSNSKENTSDITRTHSEVSK
jgi:hypothetical protein